MAEEQIHNCFKPHHCSCQNSQNIEHNKHEGLCACRTAAAFVLLPSGSMLITPPGHDLFPPPDPHLQRIHDLLTSSSSLV
ncbi:hypothetical protein NQZ68_033330 [Dissostichus eleginoides]|nr:hypothetical protein NQZ68_033330 [Dissostichus eleginoides]